MVDLFLLSFVSGPPLLERWRKTAGAGLRSFLFPSFGFVRNNLKCIYVWPETICCNEDICDVIDVKTAENLAECLRIL